MPHYFLLHDAERFVTQIQPALAASRRQGSFEPCRTLCQDLAPAVRAYGEAYHVSTAGALPFAVVEGLAYDRILWRGLVGEILLYGAAEMPEIQTAADALARLVIHRTDWQSDLQAGALYGERELLPPILQAYYGSRDLTFGGAFYRPEQVGLNDQADVSRLAHYLASIDLHSWRTDDVSNPDAITDEDELEAELDCLRDSFEQLRQLYERARDQQQVVICEVV
jgi:hypothetical protein